MSAKIGELLQMEDGTVIEIVSTTICQHCKETIFIAKELNTDFLFQAHDFPICKFHLEKCRKNKLSNN